MILLALLIEILSADVVVQQACEKTEIQVAEKEKSMQDLNCSIRNVCCFVNLFFFFLYWE